MKMLSLLLLLLVSPMSIPDAEANLCTKTWQGLVNLLRFSKIKIDAQPYYFEADAVVLGNVETQYSLGADVSFPVTEGDKELFFLTSPRTTLAIKNEISRRWKLHKDSKEIDYKSYFLDPEWEQRNNQFLLSLRFSTQDDFIRSDVSTLNEVLNQELQKMISDGFFKPFLSKSQKFVYAENPIQYTVEAADLLQDKISKGQKWIGDWKTGIHFTAGKGILPRLLINVSVKDRVTDTELDRGLYQYAMDARKEMFDRSNGGRHLGKVHPSPTGSAWLVLVADGAYRSEDFSYAIFRTEREARRFAKIFRYQMGFGV